MPSYYSPGMRNGNQTYIVRGYVNGRQREIATDATNERDAKKAWNKFKKAEEQRPQPRRGTDTFGAIADLWLDARNASKNERRYVGRLKEELGTLPIDAVKPMDIAAAAKKLYPKGSNETRNRQAYTPAAAILHWAAENELREYTVVKKLPEKRSENRRPQPNVRDILLNATEGRKHLLIAVLFYQGWRISESLGLQYEGVDMGEQTLSLFVSKSRKWKTMAMHPVVMEALSGIEWGEGKVFSWGDRHNVYRWLRPLCKKLKIKFTPHMARHEYGAMIRDSSDLVAFGSWTSEKSTQRYVTPDPARAKLVHSRLSEKGKNKGKRRK